MEGVLKNTVHMNKFNLTSSVVIDSLKSVLDRGICIIRGEKYDASPGPQWQQLELPFSRTPVKKWNR